MGLLDDLFGGGQDMPQAPDYSGQVQDYMSQVQGLANPYLKSGQSADALLSQQERRLVSDPTSVQDQIAAGYHTSPYAQNLMNQTRSMAAQNAASTGFVGTPLAQKQLQQNIGNVADQFQNQYVTQGLGQYDQGLGLAQSQAGRGMQAAGMVAGAGQTALSAQMKQAQDDYNAQLAQYKQQQKDSAGGLTALSGLAGAIGTGFGKKGGDLRAITGLAPYIAALM